MGKLHKFQIVLDNERGVFYPGDIVAGHVIVDLKEEMKIREIRACFRGYAKVHWTEREDNRTIHYLSQEPYFNIKLVLMESRQSNDITLSPGIYQYPVSFILPAGLPSSFEGTWGHVRYYIEATIDRPRVFDKHTKTLFSVINALDLNTRPDLLNGAMATDQKVLCCWCCASDPIIATMTIGRQGYVPREAILIDAEINNNSNRTMTNSKAKLIMRASYFARGETRTETKCVQEIQHGSIEAGGTDVWANEKLLVPPVAPSYLLGCGIMDVKYFATMTVDPSGVGFDLEVPIEVIIGSIPFISVAQRYGFNVQTQVIESPPPGNTDSSNINVAIENTRSLTEPNISPPSYAESVLGRMNTKEEDEGDVTGTSAFAPVYTYYNLEGKKTNAFYNV